MLDRRSSCFGLEKTDRSTQSSLRGLAILLVLGAAVVGAACESDATLSGPNEDGPGGGTVTRASLAVTVTVAGQDADIASILGSPGGILQGAEVAVRRIGESVTQRVVTDSAGIARFSDLLEGSYTVTVGRVLSGAEMALLASTDSSYADVNAFGGGGLVEVAPPAASARMPVIAGRRGSLVFSEIYSFTPFTGGTFSYSTGKYVEFYNNSDTTVYLDGKLFARALWWAWDDPRQPCASLEAWRIDPRGVWVERYVRLPGAGGQYPLAPGKAAVLAMDAIDHRGADPRLPDLSNAQFEYVGQGDVDNPQVPNVEDLGPEIWNNSLNFGMHFSGSKEVFVLVDAVDPRSLPVEMVEMFDRRDEHHLVPTEHILDVVAMTSPPPHSAGPLCARLVHEGIDAQHGSLFDTSSPLSVSRRVLLTLSDGRPLLQRTKTSARDFERRGASPGSVP